MGVLLVGATDTGSIPVSGTQPSWNSRRVCAAFPTTNQSGKSARLSAQPNGALAGFSFEFTPVLSNPQPFDPILSTVVCRRLPPHHQYSSKNRRLRAPFSLDSYVSARVPAAPGGLGEHHPHPRFRAISPSPGPRSLPLACKPRMMSSSSGILSCGCPMALHADCSRRSAGSWMRPTPANPRRGGSGHRHGVQRPVVRQTDG